MSSSEVQVGQAESGQTNSDHEEHNSANDECPLPVKVETDSADGALVEAIVREEVESDYVQIEQEEKVASLTNEAQKDDEDCSVEVEAHASHTSSNDEGQQQQHTTPKEEITEAIERGQEESSETTATATEQIMDKKEEIVSERSSPAEEISGEEKTVSVGTSTVPVTETQEVSSSTKNDHPPRSARSSSSRRPSYNSSRGYAGGYQNYGLAYLPYKSNFEPSEDSRRRADEFLKTLKL